MSDRLTIRNADGQVGVNASPFEVVCLSKKCETIAYDLIKEQ